MRNESRLASTITSCLQTGVSHCKTEREGSDRGRAACSERPLQDIRGTPLTFEEFMSDRNRLIPHVLISEGLLNHHENKEEVQTGEIHAFHRFYSYQRDLREQLRHHLPGEADTYHHYSKLTNCPFYNPTDPSIILECFVSMIFQHSSVGQRRPFL